MGLKLMDRLDQRQVIHQILPSQVLSAVKSIRRGGVAGGRATWGTMTTSFTSILHELEPVSQIL